MESRNHQDLIVLQKIELTDIDKLKNRYKNRIEDYTNILWLKDSKIGEKLSLK